MENIKPLFQNTAHTVGIVKVGREGLKRIPGYFNKEKLEEMLPLFDLFQRRDMAVFYRDGVGSNSEGASLLLIAPDEDKDVFIAVAGRSEASE
jgi:hypothetical protein